MGIILNPSSNAVFATQKGFIEMSQITPHLLQTAPTPLLSLYDILSVYMGQYFISLFFI